MLAIAAAFLLTALDMQKPVTILIKPMSAKAALVQLTDKTGVPLTIQPRLANEVVEIEVEKIPLKTLLEKLAFVLHAEVELAGDGMRITRSNQAQRELEEAEIKIRQERLQKLLDKKKLELAKYPTPITRAEALITAMKKQDDYAKEQRANGKVPGFNLDVVRQECPAGRLAFELMMLVGAREAATGPIFRPLTFANYPVKGQRPLPPGAGKFIDEYAETEQQLAGFLDSGKAEGESPSFYKDIFEAAQMPGGIGKVKFGIYRMGSFLSFSADVFTKNGKKRTYGLSSNTLMGEDHYLSLAQKLKSDAPILVPLSPLSAEMHRLVPADPNISGGPEKPATIQRMSDAMREFVSKPEAIDPLEIAGGAALRTYAATNHLDLVACLTERIPLADRDAVRGDKLDLSRFWAGLGPLAGQECRKENGMLTVRPVAPIATEEYRVSRPAIGRYYRALLAQGEETLVTLSRLHLEAGRPYAASTILRTEQGMLRRHGVTQFVDSQAHSHQFYCFIATLDPKWLEKGSGPIQVSSLNSSQRDYLLAWIMSGQEIGGEGAAALSDLMKDPMEAFGGELPAGVVNLTVEDMPAAVRSKEQFEGWPERYRDAAKFAADFAHWTRNGYKPTQTQLDAQDYLYGVIHRTRLTFQPAQDLVIQEISETGKQSTGTKPVPYSKLPEEFLGEIRRLYEEAMKKGG
jgi:hypothetical protein